VLVHGLGLSRRYMIPLAQTLARDFDVYAPDQPGFCGSDQPANVLDMAGLGGCRGAMDAQQRSAQRGICRKLTGLPGHRPSRGASPELVAAAVLQGPTAPPDERSWFWQFVRWRQNGRYNPRSLDDVTWPEYRKAGYLRVLRTFQHSLDDKIEQQLPRITAPTLIVCGEHDPICPANWARGLARLPPRGRYAEIPGVAHTLCYTAPTELAEIIHRFLRCGRHSEAPRRE
jgi:pimeloyl-ACP methyl ester carboxylesterase